MNKIWYTIDFYNALFLHRSTSSRDGIDSDFCVIRVIDESFVFFAPMYILCYNGIYQFMLLTANIRRLRVHVSLFQGIQNTESVRFPPVLETLYGGIIDHDFFKRGHGDENLVSKIIDELDSLRDKVKAP